MLCYCIVLCVRLTTQSDCPVCPNPQREREREHEWSKHLFISYHQPWSNSPGPKVCEQSFKLRSKQPGYNKGNGGQVCLLSEPRAWKCCWKDNPTKLGVQDLAKANAVSMDSVCTKSHMALAGFRHDESSWDQWVQGTTKATQSQWIQGIMKTTCLQ